MCGITGFGKIGKNAEPRWIKDMTDVIRHRGPDDEGYLAIHSGQRNVYHLTGKDSRVTAQSVDSFSEKVDFWLGHRRLSILDPTPAGHQPMCTADGDVWVVFNGEIYNYIELRGELRIAGHSFRTDSDTEVLLAAYLEWGERCLERFDGMWAFVLYDRRKNILFGARDRFGVKPLYYYHESGYFAFSSEIKALVSLPFVEPAINRPVVFDYLVFGGLDFVEETFFDKIIELPPSHMFSYDLTSGEFKKLRYYSLELNDKWESFDEKRCREHVHNIRDLVTDAVKLRLRSDVPVGSALSGGIDSSTIVCIISRLLEREGSACLRTQTGKRQKVFTAGFPGTDVDESKWADKVAKKAGAQWFVTKPNTTEYLEDMEDIAYYQDTPFGSPSVYAQYRVMRLARENGVKVILDGQGADELFTGYTMYYCVLFHQLLKRMEFRTFFHELQHLGNAPVERKTLISDIRKQFRRSILPYTLIRKYRMTQKAPFHFIEKEFWSSYKERFDLLRARDFTTLNGMLHQYFTRQKLGTLLKYEDRNSMRFSIESRTPFADHLNLIEYVFKVPGAYKIHNGWSKYLLREAMTDILPDEVRLRTDKKGFFIPDVEWLSQLKDYFREYLTDDMKEFVDIPLVINQLEHGMKGTGYECIQIIWNIIGLAMWRRVYSL
jgi:asparagine synthase (glutamine-hydrolysing)